MTRRCGGYRVAIRQGRISGPVRRLRSVRIHSVPQARPLWPRDSVASTEDSIRTLQRRNDTGSQMSCRELLGR